MLTNNAVMSNLNQIVELNALLNHCVVQRATIDGCICANVYIVSNQHTADLRYFYPRTILICISKSISANHCSSSNIAISSYNAIRVNGDIRLQLGIFSNDDIIANKTSSTDHNTICQANILTNHNIRANAT